MLRLFAGRENIDKERFIYGSVKEHGGETFVLVPDQYTLVAEEQALKYLGSECLFDVEIISMNRLGLRVLTEQGKESVRMLDKYGRFMLLSMLIREHAEDFEIFRRSAGRITFTAMLNDFISEFKQQDCTLEKLQEMLADADGDPLLEAKIKELSGVISAYEEAIAGRYTDSEDYISMYVSAFRDSQLIKGKKVWIYGYDSITPKFADAVMELADAAESVSFIVNRSDFGLDEKLTASLERLAAELRNCDIECEFADRDFLVMMWSPANDDEDYERVSHAFAEVRNEFVTGDAASDSGLPAYSLPEVKFRYSDILFSDYEEIEVSEALGRVSMEAAAKCPPAILPIVPGEVINEDVIKILNFYGIKTIRVRI